MDDDLEERLRSHEQAFEGLLSLIPANQYYNQTPCDHWQGQKHTKEQKRQAKAAKFDPANQKSAKDILDDNERKRKRELQRESGEDTLKATQADFDSGNSGSPNEPRKRQRLESEHDEKPSSSDKKSRKLEKRERKAQQKLDKAAQKAGSKDDSRAEDAQDRETKRTPDTARTQSHGKLQHVAATKTSLLSGTDLPSRNKVDSPQISTPNSPASPRSTESLEPSLSSSSSVPPAESELPRKPWKVLKLSPEDQEAAKARLHARIQALRDARKADGPDGKPARTRQELMESRRRKEEQRKAHKKEVRAKAKEEDGRQAAELELARLRGSDSPLTPDIFSPRTEQQSISFGQIRFDDGERLDLTSQRLRGPLKKKSATDTKAALQALDRKAERLGSSDPKKMADIVSKDMWLTARRRAEGEKIKDNTSLLRKTLKQKEKAKQKSQMEWNERIDNARKGKEAKQQKREANIQKRKEQKGSKEKKNGPKGKKSKARPGFEGSFRTKPR